jgi:choline dehydrogenase-like flavoprotein
MAAAPVNADELRADYIVVGGGSAGCVVASRLSEDAGTSVLLLEEGGPDSSPYIHVPGAYYKTAQGALLKRYPWISPESHGRDSPQTMVQASVLGGGSSVNAMIYIRGVPADYDRWAANGAVGWSYEDVLPYFTRAEDNNRFSNAVHGVGGPIGVSDPDYIHPLSRVWLRACQQAGLPFNPDFNSGTSLGCGIYQINTRAGRRSSAAVEYLPRARPRGNLSVRTGCRATRVVFEGQRAVGVEFVTSGKLWRASCNREVVLCAGAINTPKLLLLSGIGDPAHLEQQGVAVQHALPGVGLNLQDHIEASLVYQLKNVASYDKYKKFRWQTLAALRYLLFRDGPASSNLIESGAFWGGELSDTTPDIQYFFIPGAGIEEGVDGVPGGSGCTVNIGQIRPRSRGSVRLAGPDPTLLPEIRPNYFAEAYDLERLVQGCELAAEIMTQPAFRPYVACQHTPGARFSTRQDSLLYWKKYAHAALHPAGTCRMGTDELAVVDSRLQVKGLERLRVIDASVMPTLVSGNTNAAVIMIGEKGASMIRHDRY